MSRLLVLVRHGKPQPADGTTPDKLRELTKEGQAALEGPNGLTQAFELLSNEERALAAIWTSSAVRAKQTASVVSHILGGTLLQEHRSLWEQDDAGFLEEVALSSTSCIIAVGHIPFMHRITKRLVGDDIAFKPGAVCAIELADNIYNDASRLAWFIQGPKVD